MVEPFLIYAHRGSSVKYPENTMLAFEKAISTGANGIELDVQLTRDKEVVIFHDWRLDRVFNKPGKISDYTLAELKGMDAGKWKGNQFRGIKIPSLEEFMQFASRNKFVINIELKNFFSSHNGLENKVIRLLNKYQLVQQTVISTFNPLSLNLLKELDSRLRLALLYFGHLDKPWEFANKCRCEFIHPPFSEISKEMIQECHERQLKVIPYHINDKDTMIRMYQDGVDGFITSRPKTAVTLINSMNEK